MLPSRRAQRVGAASLMLLGSWWMAAGCDAVSGIDDLVFERGVGAFCGSGEACGDGLYCDLELRTCAAQDIIGVNCSSHAQCESGRCVDGFCCNGPCNVACLACDRPVADKYGVEHLGEGHCVALKNEDPHDDCAGTAQCGEQGRCEGLHVWSATYGDSGPQRAADVAIDGDGNTVVLGTFAGTINFGKGPHQTQTQGAFNDVFVAGFRADDSVEWSLSVGDSGEERAAAVAVDDAGNIYMAGTFSGTVDFSGDPNNALSRTAVDLDGFVLKLVPDRTDPEDVVVKAAWVTTFGGMGDQSIADMAAGPDGKPVVAGSFVTEIDYGGSIVLSSGAEDAFVAWLDTDGNISSNHREFGDAEVQTASAITMDLNGDVVVAVNGRGQVLGLNTGTDNDSTWLLKLRDDASTAWQLLSSGSGYQHAGDVIVDDLGDVWLTGSFTGAVTPPGAVVELSGSDDVDGFFVKLNGMSAEPIVTGVLLGPFDDTPHGITIDSNGSVVLVGGFELSLQAQLDGMDPDPPISAVGAQDAFVLKLASDATPRWGQPFGGPLFDEAVAVASDDNGNIVVVGHFEHRINFQGTLHEAAGDTDFFVARFAR